MSETGPRVDHGTYHQFGHVIKNFFFDLDLENFSSRYRFTISLRNAQLELGYYSSYHNFDDTFKWVYKSQKLTGSIHFDIRRPENVEFHR